eukprot:14154925-Ditylum_brightwellii.AAC.1
MAQKRQQQQKGVISRKTTTGTAPAITTGGREEWMLEPGEHDILSGIKSAGVLKNRKFRNEKVRQRHDDNAEEKIMLSPELQAQIEHIKKVHEEARGPSLIDLHRVKRTAEKEEERTQGEGKWKWNREKHLDEGRRVDKNALHQVLGGAKRELNDKFQGGSGYV